VTRYTRESGGFIGSSATSRSIDYTLSTSAVARDNHTIDQAGWKLDTYRSNPVFLWAHDTSAAPIGKMSSIGVTGGALRGTVTYAETDFADTILRLVQGSFIRAVSVAWDPITWSYTKDRSRPNGIDFQEQELLEVSQVPVPCDPNALAAARSRGINTAPLYRWAEKALDTGGNVAMPRQALEELRRGAKMPTQPHGTMPTDFLRMATRLDRERTARFVAYDLCRTQGVPVAAFALPARSRDERRALAEGAQIAARQFRI
jgi:HK97 family phage prohead protease